jgi:hypothetical protein
LKNEIVKWEIGIEKWGIQNERFEIVELNCEIGKEDVEI